MNAKDLAKRCYDEADGDWDKTLELLGRVRRTPALTDEVYAAHWSYLVREIAREKRARVFRDVFKPTPERPGGLREAAPALERSYLETYRLRGGRRLGDATPKEMRLELEWHRTEHLAHGVKVRFFEAILKKVPEDKRVRDVLTDEQLGQLASRARVVKK